MDDSSKIIKEEFEEQLKTIKELDKKDNKLKVMIINISFIAAFIFVLYGAIVSYHKYIDKRDGTNNVALKR